MLEEPQASSSISRRTAKSLNLTTGSARSCPGPRSRAASLRQQKKALLKLAKTRFSRSNLEATFRRITETATRCLNSTRAGLWLFSPDRATVQCHQLFDAAAGSYSSGSELEVAKFPLYFKSLEAQRTIAAGNVESDSRMVEFWKDYMAPNNIRASIDAAIRLNGRVVGMICVEAPSIREWSADEEQFAGSLADIAALALKDAELRREETLRKAFAELGKKLNACTTPQMAVSLIGKTAQKLWGWDALFLHLYDPVANRLVPVLNMDTVNGRRMRVPFVLTDGADDAIPEEKLLLNGELPPGCQLTRFGDVQRPSRSRMYITIRHKNRRLAVLSIQSYSPNAYDKAALDGLESLGQYCTGAIARLQAEALRRESEERFRGLAEASTEGILIHNSTRIFEVNSELCRIFGYTDAELKQKRPSDLLAHATKRKIPGPGSGSYEAPGRRKDGSDVPLEIVTRPCRYLGKAAKVTVIRDISERKKIERQLRNHSRQILEAQENERFRVSRDLHDSVNQVLTAARLTLETMGRSLPKGSHNSRACAAKTQELLGKAMEEIRLISWNLRPNELDDAGLPTAIRTLCSDCQERTGVAFNCDFPEPFPHLDPAAGLALFRIAQEALNNASRHSAASRVDVTIGFSPEVLTMEIADDGIGFCPETLNTGDGRKGGLGLTNMRERAIAARGTFEVRAEQDKGVRIRLSLPLPSQANSSPPAKAAP